MVRVYFFSFPSVSHVKVNVLCLSVQWLLHFGVDEVRNYGMRQLAAETTFSLAISISLLMNNC
jgi:hypothetical protein